MIWIFTIYYYLFDFSYSKKIRVTWKVLCITQLKFYKEHQVYSIKYFKQHNKKNNLKDKNLTKNKYCLEKIKTEKNA